MKKLQVPFNGDLDILNLYQLWSNYISEIYFPLHPNIFPSARQRDFPPVEEWNNILIEVCKTMSSVQIDCAVILNGIRADYSNDNLDILRNSIELLIPYGLNKIVVADPILSSWIYKNFPNIGIRLSVLSGINDIETIKEIEKLGYIKEICLPQSLNKDEDTLKELKEKTSLKYSTIVNSLCRVNCPLFYWHQNLYSSNNIDWLDENVISQIKTSFSFASNKLTKNYLKSSFILPNELYYYDRYFNYFKLEDRTLPTIRISKILEHYALRVNPDFLVTCISGSCIYLDHSVKCNFDKKWLKYRRNCKGQCWNCSLCDKLRED